MKLIGLMPARNEDWVIRASARAALQWCDHLIVLDHASTDRTAEFVTEVSLEHPGRLTVLSKADEWHEMAHRQLMLDTARTLGATHIAIVDADEVVTANITGQMKQMVFDTPSGSMLVLPGYNLRGSIWDYHLNGLWGQRWFSVAFPDSEDISWSAWGDSFHHREPRTVFDSYAPLKQGAGGIMHLWGVTERRLRAKHALYKMTERRRWPMKSVLEIERQYNAAIYEPKEQSWAYGSIPEAWWAQRQWWLNELATPWQAAECQRLYEKYGAGAFRDLDLFGVIHTKELIARE